MRFLTLLVMVTGICLVITGFQIPGINFRSMSAIAGGGELLGASIVLIGRLRMGEYT